MEKGSSGPQKKRNVRAQSAKEGGLSARRRMSHGQITDMTFNLLFFGPL